MRSPHHYRSQISVSFFADTLLGFALPGVPPARFHAERAALSRTSLARRAKEPQPTWSRARRGVSVHVHRLTGVLRMRRQRHDRFRPLPKPSGFSIRLLSARAARKCRLHQRFRRAELERQLLAGLQERVIHADVVDYTLKRFEEQIAKALVARSKDGDDLRRQEGELERKIANQLRGLADGYSPSITSAIGALEAQLADVRSRIQSSNPQRVNLQLRHTCRFVTNRLRDLGALWNGEPRIAREEIAKHVRKIRLEPRLRTYFATGT